MKRNEKKIDMSHKQICKWKKKPAPLQNTPIQLFIDGNAGCQKNVLNANFLTKFCNQEIHRKTSPLVAHVGHSAD